MKKILISIIALFSVLPLFADVTLYLNTGGDALWNQGGAKFAIYYFNSEDDNGWSDLMTVESGNIYKGTIPEDFAYVKFVRLNSSATAGDWSKVWNKTADLSLGADTDNLYTITSWGGETDNGEWSTYTPAPAVITYDTSMYVAGSSTYLQDFMKKLPWTYEFNIDEELEFKQVKRVIKFEDGVAVDTTYTWYGCQNESASMTQGNSSWKLDSTGTYNVHIIIEDGGDYTFSCNAENGNFEVAWPDEPAPVARIYAKNNWDGAQEWSWKEMEVEYPIYSLNNVVFGGTGVYINDRESDVDAIWYDLKTMHYVGGTDTIRVNDIVNFTFNKVDSIFVAELVSRPTSPVSVTVGTSGYATIVTPNNLTVPSDVEVFGYTFDDFSVALIPGDAITAGEILPSGKGYVVKAAQGSYTFEFASAAAGTTAKFASDLTGWTMDKAASEVEGTVYGLGIVSEKVGFYKFSGATISAGKAVYVKPEN